MALFESYERRINQILPLLKKYGIKMQLNNCPDNVVIEANAEQLHKTLMSFADNK